MFTKWEVVNGAYGNLGCQVSKEGIQNQLDV